MPAFDLIATWLPPTPLTDPLVPFFVVLCESSGSLDQHPSSSAALARTSKERRFLKGAFYRIVHRNRNICSLTSGLASRHSTGSNMSLGHGLIDADFLASKSAASIRIIPADC